MTCINLKGAGIGRRLLTYFPLHKDKR